MRVIYRRPVGDHAAGDEGDIPDAEAERLAAQGAVSIVQRSRPRPAVSVSQEPEEDACDESE